MVAHAHDQHDDHDHSHGVDHSGHEQMFRNRFWVCLALTVPVLLYSPTLQDWFGFAMPTFTGSSFIGPLFAVIVFAVGGVPFLQMAVPEVRKRQPGMMTLIGLAITVAFAYSLFALLTGTGKRFFWEMATLIDVMLLGHWMEMRSVRQASGALDELAKLMPDTAERVTDDGETETVPVTELEIRRCATGAAGGERAGRRRNCVRVVVAQRGDDYGRVRAGQERRRRRGHRRDD